MTVEVLVQKNGSAEFDCISCGTHVFRAIARPGQGPVCAQCEWIDRVASDPEEREALRRHFGIDQLPERP